MAILPRSMVLFLVVSLPAVLHAAEKFDASAEAKVLSPFIEADTVAVVHVDFSRVSIDPIMTMFDRWQSEVKEDLFNDKPDAVKGLNGFLRAGGKDAYLVVTLGGGSIVPRVFIVFPIGPNVDDKALRAAADIPADVGRRVGDVLVVPANPGFQLPAEFHPVDRPELTAALSAAGDTTVQAVLIPSVSARRVIEELLPQLPAQVGGGASTVLTHGVVWAAAGLDLPPRLNARLLIQSQDAQAAQALLAKWLECLSLAGKQKEIRQVLPQFEKLAAAVTPEVAGDRLVLSCAENGAAIGELVAALEVPITQARNNAKRMVSMNNLKQIGLAMCNYYDAKKHLPPPARHGRDGKPLLSWRVQILPYLDEQKLYEQFHLDESWDSPHNKSLIDKMPPVFRSPKSKAAKGTTNYVVPVGDGALFSSMKDQPHFKEVKDGLSRTIMTIEVDDQHAVVWTQPDDLQFDPVDPKKSVGSLFAEGINVGMCDGSVRTLRTDIDPKMLKALITRAGGELIDLGGL